MMSTIKGIEGEWVRIAREDGTDGRLALDRLLATDGAGTGLYFQFHGWRSLRRGYRTSLVVTALDRREKKCLVRLPEWDSEVDVAQPLAVLPEDLRKVGAKGSCMADLSSSSAAGLNIHSCRCVRAPQGSRSALSAHPDRLAEGQRFQRRADGARFLLLNDGQPHVRAWNGSRVVRLSRDRLLATGADGAGEIYEYLGGGVREARRARHAADRRQR
jgi:hypothetical protein